MNRPVPLKVWVPPGRTPVVSPGVEVQWMPAGSQDLALAGAERRSQRAETGWTSMRDAAAKGGQDEMRLWGSGAAGPQAGSARPGRAAAVAEPEADGAGDLSELSYLTPELLALADEVMAQYPMKVSGMQFITAKPDKGGAIWRIATDHGPRSLKQLHRPARRSLFSVGAQEYLVSRGARVPALVRTRDGQLAVEREGKLWIVTDWVEPLIPASKVDLTGAQALCYGLGEFHMHSRGYLPPPGAQKSSRLYKWPNAYRKMITKIGWFRQLARVYPEMDASPIILAVVDEFEAQAKRAAERLEASPYKSLAARGEPAWGLVHQDEGTVQGSQGRIVTGVPVGTRR